MIEILWLALCFSILSLIESSTWSPPSVCSPFDEAASNENANTPKSGQCSESPESRITSNKKVPVIDLSRDDNDPELIHEIAQACIDPGFFQVIHHGIPQPLMEEFRHQCQLFYALPDAQKQAWKRHASNARGYFDDELTKQRRDWKQALDIGVPGSRDWILADDDPRNACLDGFNQFPPTNILPDYRRVTIEYFHACEVLSKRLAMLMARGLEQSAEDDFIKDLAANHSSYLRTNYYPPYTAQKSDTTNGDLGISPHKDAGFLTVLLQDDDCHSLQVPGDGGDWVTVEPIAGSLTINTGDMAQIWSNGKYQAPLHRVLTNSIRPRYSAPFFYNPPYHATVAPTLKQNPKYHPVLWAYFRALRFAGDLTNLGLEIQIEDFEVQRKQPSDHLKRQQVFSDRGLSHKPFDVEQYRNLLTTDEE